MSPIVALLLSFYCVKKIDTKFRLERPRPLRSTTALENKKKSLIPRGRRLFFIHRESHYIDYTPPSELIDHVSFYLLAHNNSLKGKVGNSLKKWRDTCKTIRRKIGVQEKVFTTQKDRGRFTPHKVWSFYVLVKGPRVGEEKKKTENKQPPKLETVPFVLRVREVVTGPF